MDLRSLARDCSCSYRSPEPPGRLGCLGPARLFGNDGRRRRCGLLVAQPRTQSEGPGIRLPRAADMAADAPQPQEPDGEPPQVGNVFPRIRESNPWRRLGVSEEASFEEVQEARNFLYGAYKSHEASREAIELAYEKILKVAFKRREKFGFQPPKTGRKTDAQGDVLPPSLLERVKDAVEPSVGIATLVNDGSIFLVLSIWAAWQATATDPTFPVLLAFTYSAYKFFTKRKNRNPDGPHFGGSPIWAALGMTAVGLALGMLVSTLLVKFVPLPPKIAPDAAGLFVLCLIVGVFTIFFR